MPCVSVIIPTFNRAQWVQYAIESVLGQSFPDLEVIVVDDGSTDNTSQVIHHFHDHRLKYIYQTNSGVSCARNAGVRDASGHWVAFLDSDDEWSSTYLERQLACLNIGSRCVVMQSADCRIVSATTGTRSYFALNRCTHELGQREHLIIERPFRFIVEHQPWQLGSTLILRTALLRAGLFNPSLTLSEDIDLMARVSLLGPFGLIRDQLVHVHRRSEETECLTNRSRRDPIGARQSMETIYERLARLQLDRSERAVLHSLMGANRRAMGNLLLAAGCGKRARESYQRALSYDRSWRSVGRYLLSMAPALARVWE